MKLDPDVGTVVYNDLPMQRTGVNTLYCDDNGAIMDWLSRYDYPRQLITQGGTTTVVHRPGELDLILVNPSPYPITVQDVVDAFYEPDRHADTVKTILTITEFPALLRKHFAKFA